MASSSSSSKVNLTLVIGKTHGKLIFADARRDFVDLLSHAMEVTLNDTISIAGLGLKLSKLTTSGVMELKESTRFIIMDDLEVKRRCLISGLVLIKACISAPEEVEERTVELGTDEVIKLVQASSQSETVLTDMFISGN